MTGQSSPQQQQQQQGCSLLLLYSVFIPQDLLRISVMVAVFVVVVFVCIVSDSTVMNICYTVLCSDSKYVVLQFKMKLIPV